MGRFFLHFVLHTQKAIASAHTLEEVERLNKMLQSGQIPGAADIQTNGDGEQGESEQCV